MPSCILFEAAYQFLTFRDIVRCRIVWGKHGISDCIYRLRLRQKIGEVVKSSRVRYGSCVIDGCHNERLLRITLTGEGVRRLSWYPYCGMHKRIHQHRERS